MDIFRFADQSGEFAHLSATPETDSPNDREDRSKTSGEPTSITTTTPEMVAVRKYKGTNIHIYFQGTRQ